jgi:hypothetical protein
MISVEQFLRGVGSVVVGVVSRFGFEVLRFVASLEGVRLVVALDVFGELEGLLLFLDGVGFIGGFCC